MTMISIEFNSTKHLSNGFIVSLFKYNDWFGHKSGERRHKQIDIIGLNSNQIEFSECFQSKIVFTSLVMRFVQKLNFFVVKLFWLLKQMFFHHSIRKDKNCNKINENNIKQVSADNQYIKRY